MLTSNEIKALDAILAEAVDKSAAEDDGDPLYHEVLLTDVNPFPDKVTQKKVYESLSQKGLIDGSVYMHMGTEEEFVCITQQGYEAFLAASAPH